MDSKTVNKEIRALIWPALKAAGFSSFSTRTAWRHEKDQVEVVNFQSFNRHNADVLGVTTFSFSVNLGSYLFYVPPQWPPKIKTGRPMPIESQCHFRGRIARTISQKSNKHPDIWLVDNDARNLAWCLKDVENKIPTALAWFDRLRDKSEVLRILLTEAEEMSILWGFGNNPSPVRSYLSGYVALNLGNRNLAESKLREAADSKCFAHLFSTVEGALQRAL